jgi:hypothetical protein
MPSRENCSARAPPTPAGLNGYPGLTRGRAAHRQRGVQPDPGHGDPGGGRAEQAHAALPDGRQQAGFLLRGQARGDHGQGPDPAPAALPRHVHGR